MINIGDMSKEEYSEKYFNKVDHLSAVCRTNSSWAHGEYPELEIGKTYQVSHIGVMRSSTKIRLSEFGNKEYNSTCFDLYENGKAIADGTVEHNYGSIIFLVGLAMPHYRLLIPSASLDMNLRQCFRVITPTATNSGTACFLTPRRAQAS